MKIFNLIALLVLGLGLAHASDPVVDIHGVQIGMTLEDAKKLLDPLGSGEGIQTRSGDHKHAWTLPSGPYKAVALKVSKKGSIAWITAFVREGYEIPFDQLGGSLPGSVSDNQGIWSVEKPVPVRLVAKGSGKKASVISLLSLVK